MAEWQERFTKRLSALKDVWREEFDRVAEEALVPAFERMRGFLTANGFQLSVPRDDGDRRAFRFALGEDVYVLVTFQFRGPSEVEAVAEIASPSVTGVEVKPIRAPIRSVTADWALQRMQAALDLLVTQLEETANEPAAQFA